MAHIHDPGVDFVVVAFLVYAKKVLLVFHNELQEWLPVGGHIELNEDPDHALLREIEEETGFKPREVRILAHRQPKMPGSRRRFLLTSFGSYVTPISKTHMHIALVYAGISKHDNVRLALQEHAAIRWLSKQDLRNPKFHLDPIVRFYAKEAMSRAEFSGLL